MESKFLDCPPWAKGKAIPRAELMQSTMVREAGTNAAVLNANQLRAAEDITGKVVVEAGAGTGKSTLLVARMQRILADYPDAKVLMISFTKKSALDLRERIGDVHGVIVSTLHSLAYKICRAHGYSKYRVETSESLIAAMVKRCIFPDDDVTPEEIIKSQAYLQCECDVIAKVRQRYLEVLEARHILTFDSILLKAVDILTNAPGVLRLWQSRYDYVLLDESQDISEPQLKLVELLADNNGNLCCCGDSRQSIYSFRGAAKNVMKHLSNGANCYDLTINYRSSRYILGLGNSIMHEYKPLTAASLQVHEDKPKYLEASDEKDEAKEVAKEICKLVKAGYRYKDIMILYRSYAASQPTYQELVTNKIPAVNQSDSKFRWQTRPYHYPFNIFKFAVEPTKSNFKDIAPLLYISSDNLNKVIKAVAKGDTYIAAIGKLGLPFFQLEYIDKMLSAITAIRDVSPHNAIEQLLSAGLEKYVGEDYSTVLHDYADDLIDYNNIGAYLQHCHELEDQQKQLQKLIENSDDYVSMMSIHRSKGLESKCVFLIGCHDGSIPSAADGVDIEEERRLLYVAVTRAKEKLYISYPKHSRGKNNEACRFLRQAFAISQKGGEYHD